MADNPRSKLSTKELAAQLQRKAFQQRACGGGPLICHCGRKKSSVHFDLCWRCECRARKSEKNKARSEREKGPRLPAKNQKKSKIVNALMAGLPLPKPEPKKPKTILRSDERLRVAILLADLKKF